MSYEKIISSKKDNKSPTIISLGSSLNLELILSLEENQFESIGIKYKEISKVDDLINLFPSHIPSFSLKMKKLTSLIELHTDNFLFNSILFMNQSSKKKLPIIYLIPFSPKFTKELNFIYYIIKSITETNNIYIEDSNLLDIKPNIVLTLKLIEKDIIVDTKSFLITDENHYNNTTDNENKKDENEYDGDLFKGLNYEINYDYFYSTINELINCKKNSENEIIKFIKSINNKYPNVKICINFDENFDNKNFVNNIIENTNIFIFDKKDIIHFDNMISSINKEEKKENQKSKDKNNTTLREFFINKIKTDKINLKLNTGIFINDLKEILIIQKHPETNSILFQTNQSINLIPQDINEKEITKYKELISTKYNLIKSVYIGAFLNRFFRQESFDKCLRASLKCSILYIDVLKFGLDVPSLQNYYELKNAKNHKKKLDKNEIKNKILENKFVLDCTNVNNKINSYNSLYDHNCINFLNSKETRKHLQKQGFINKKGMILEDPEKRRENFINIKTDKYCIFRKFKLKLNNLRDIRTNNDIRGEKQSQISQINQKALKNYYSFKDISSIHQENSHSLRHFYLPKIKNKNVDFNHEPNCLKKFDNLYGENNKEDNKKSLNNRKKNLSELNYNKKILLAPLKSTKKFNAFET